MGAGTPGFGPSSAAFPDAFAGCSLERRAAMTIASAPEGSQHCKWYTTVRFAAIH